MVCFEVSRRILEYLWFFVHDHCIVGLVMPGHGGTHGASNALLEHLSETMGDGVLTSSTFKKIVVGGGMFVFPSCAPC